VVYRQFSDKLKNICNTSRQIQLTAYSISLSAEFCGTYGENMLAYFFLSENLNGTAYNN